VSTLFLTGQRLTADLLNANIADWMPATYVKPAFTSRASTTTYADDPDLQGIALAVGTYEIELMLFYAVYSGTTQKIKTQWGFTGTWNNPDRGTLGPGAGNIASSDDAASVNARAYAANVDNIYNQLNAVNFGVGRELSRNVQVTVAGNLSLKWAQQTSSANVTRVEAGTCFNIRKIA
jgi:hypothetical protein